MIDPVYVINITPGRPMFAGIIPRDVFKFWVSQASGMKLQGTELDPILKNEYADFLIRAK
jgi:hypothetical protein